MSVGGQASRKRRTMDSKALAFRELYESHFDFVWRSLIRLGVPVAEAPDAAQEVFVVVFRRLDAFEGRSALTTWLFQIARHVAQHHHRTTHRRKRRTTALSQASPSGTVTPLERVDAGHALHRLLQRLDQPKREVFILAKLEGLTTPEIAASLGLKEPTVYSRLQAARRRLEKLATAPRQEEDDDGFEA